jgi:hypothetical protein
MKKKYDHAELSNYMGVGVARSAGPSRAADHVHVKMERARAQKAVFKPGRDAGEAGRPWDETFDE